MNSPRLPDNRKSPRQFARRTLTLLFLIALIAAGAVLGSSSRRLSAGSSRPSGPRPLPASEVDTHRLSPADVQRLRNLGKAYYEQGKYDDAVAQFEKVVGSGQTFATDHLDLGLALLQDNQLDQALGELTTTLQMDPKLLAVHYNLGVLYKRELRYPDSEAELRHVVNADSSDPAAWFNLGTVYFAEKNLPDALNAFHRVADMGFGRAQNFYVAATFHMFTILTRLRRPEEAQKYLKINQSLRDRVPNISIQYPALEAGKYGAVIVPPAALPSPPSNPRVQAFAEITSRLGIGSGEARPKSADLGELKSSGFSPDAVRRAVLPLFPLSFAIGDYDGDGHPDVYVVEPGGHNRLLRNNGNGGFIDVTEKAGVAGDGRAISAVFADYDNSGHPSLITAGLGGITVFHNKGDGTFSNDTAKAGLTASPGELDTAIVAFDSDNDGFLDVVTTAYTDLAAGKAQARFPQDFGGGCAHLWRNNGDGTFADVTAAAGLGAAHGKLRGALFADFNDDGYADLILLRENEPPLLYINKGEDHFADATASAGPDFVKLAAVAGQVVDLNHDGFFDLVLWSPAGYSILFGQGGGAFAAVDLPPALPMNAAPFAALGAVADLDGDGFDDLFAFDASGAMHVVLNSAGQFRDAGTATLGTGPLGAAPGAIAAASLMGPARLDLMTASPDGALRVFEGPPNHWAEVDLDGYKSNKQGVGSVVEFKAGEFYAKVLATGEPVRIFTGKLDKLDVVRVTWPNLIVENDIDVAGGKPLSVKESERLASSCPFLYVWNGERYVFLSDIMGVAPIGELAPDGSTLKPNPDQVVRLGDAPRARNGKLTFQLTSEMRETDYFDELRLAAVDHPASESIYPNEIYASTPAPPEVYAPEVYAVAALRPPIAAVDDHGRNVLPLVRDVDGRYPAAFRQDRILGLAENHALTLDLGRFADSDHPALWLTGWVFWTDSNASRALVSNRAKTMISPYLEVRDAQGKWVTAIADMGLPAGTGRSFRVDLTGKFPTRDHHVRIVTNLCVYWDRIALSMNDRRLPDPFAASVAPANTMTRPNERASELPLAAADLHYRGFSLPVTDPHHVKPDDFDYAHRLVDAPWNPFHGRFTRFGPVEPLLARADDRLVVMTAGDELTVSFDVAHLPALPVGWRRDYLLYARGYAKDGEPNTAAFRSSEPLPFYGMSNYPYPEGEHAADSPEMRDYLTTYQTRSGYELIPRLAPPSR